MALTKEQIKEFKKAEKEAQDSDDFREVAKNIAEFYLVLDINSPCFVRHPCYWHKIKEAHAWD